MSENLKISFKKKELENEKPNGIEIKANIVSTIPGI